MVLVMAAALLTGCGKDSALAIRGRHRRARLFKVGILCS